MKHLKYTLPLNLKVADSFYPAIEIVLLDYDSPDGLVEWVEKTCSWALEKKVLRFFSSKVSLSEFHMSHAKNVVHKLAKGEYLCNLDADNCIQEAYVSLVLDLFKKYPNHLIQGGRDSAGKICISKKNFFALQGYDEGITGWSWDDLDFINRAGLFLTPYAFYLPQFDLSLRHGHNERLLYNREGVLLHYWKKNKRLAEGNRKFKRYVANFGKKWGELPVKEHLV